MNISSRLTWPFLWGRLSVWQVKKVEQKKNIFKYLTKKKIDDLEQIPGMNLAEGKRPTHKITLNRIHISNNRTNERCVYPCKEDNFLGRK